MAAILLTTFSNVVSWMKSFVFRFRFHWSLFLRGSKWQWPSTGIDNGLAPNRRQAIIWTNADPIHGRIYVARGSCVNASRSVWMSFKPNPGFVSAINYITTWQSFMSCLFDVFVFFSTFIMTVLCPSELDLGRCSPVVCSTWWRHQMETFSALLALCAGNSPVTGEFPSQRPVTRSFDIFVDLCPNKQLSKQSWGWWFGKLSHSLWRHCNDTKRFCE